ncbi:MAG: hypothetical protein ACE15B_06910 [Bryobacteraceae bacterium]
MYTEYPDEFYTLVDQYVGRYGGRPEAADAVRRARPDLRPAPATRNVPSPGPHAAIMTGSAERQLDALARRIAAERRITYAQAYVEALHAQPALYAQYLNEHEAAMGTRRG